PSATLSRPAPPREGGDLDFSPPLMRRGAGEGGGVVWFTAARPPRPRQCRVQPLLEKEGIWIFPSSHEEGRRRRRRGGVVFGRRHPSANHAANTSFTASARSY